MGVHITLYPIYTTKKITHVTATVPKMRFVGSRRVARGGAMGAIAPPIQKVAPKIFRLIKFLVCKPNKYFRANQSNCLRNLPCFSF